MEFIQSHGDNLAGLDLNPGVRSQAKFQLLLVGYCIQCVWRGLGRGEGRDYRDVFCEELPEVSPMIDRTNASQLQVRPATGQVSAEEQTAAREERSENV